MLLLFNLPVWCNGSLTVAVVDDDDDDSSASALVLLWGIDPKIAAVEKQQ